MLWEPHIAYWLIAGEVGLFCLCMGGLMYYKCALDATTPDHTIYILLQHIVACIIDLLYRRYTLRCSIISCEVGGQSTSSRGDRALNRFEPGYNSKSLVLRCGGWNWIDATSVTMSLERRSVQTPYTFRIQYDRWCG